MTDKIKEADKEILKRVMAEPTFEAVRKAMIAENRKREEEIRQALTAPARETE